ncbi:putative protein kinase RLK-Pelle-LRR-I-1 family [Medicago truncatula]|uniref:Protein kinase domain-containing protein n=1 Tax=Medicago truncatula TaxID=3880 RepID=A0A396GFC6_MEDTR|nr:putative protein kinase RLK-Pelle-LRR-I-1 family [Medicago truncatula]
MITNILAPLTFFSVDDNPDLCMTESCGKKNFFVPLIIIALIVMLLIFLGYWIFRTQKATCLNSKKRRSMKSKNQTFSYAEILNITNNFKTITGEGGFGKVYIGFLQDHTQVAAELLMIVHHRNLVSLIGYCDEGKSKALVYEYMAKGNLQ